MSESGPKLRYTTLPQFILSFIRLEILQGRFKPGDKIDQETLAHELGVSRIPVREALRTLEAEGLVVFTPNRGVWVVELTFDEAQEIHAIRSVLEGMAARIAAGNMSGDALTRIGDALANLRARTGDLDEWLDAHSDFHLAVYAAAKRPRLLELILSLRNVVQPYIRDYIRSPGHLEAADRGHAELIEACASGDGEKAEQAAKAHLQDTWDSIISKVATSSTSHKEVRVP